MASGRWWRSNSLRARMMAGGAMALCCGPVALAQTPPASPSAPVAADSGREGPVNLESDLLRRTQEGVVTAEGNVEGRYMDRSLCARTLSFDAANHVISGEDVTIVDDLGNAEFARSMTFNEDLNSGVATGFAASQGQAKFAAA